MKFTQIDTLPPVLQEAIRAGVDRTICPMCSGGRSHESSLSIRESEGGFIKLSCWRASCGWFVSLLPVGASWQSRHIKPARPFERPTCRVGPALGAMLGVEYGLSLQYIDRHGWKQETEPYDGELTLVYEIRSPIGLTLGHVTRTFTDPKRCFTHKVTAQPFLDWWKSPGKTVIVEDCLSACRLSQLGYQAVALLGTNMSNEDAQQIADFSTQEVYLALDRDAFEKSLKIAQRHRHVLQMKPICLDADIKNMKLDADICALFGDNYGRDTTTGGDVRESESL